MADTTVVLECPCCKIRCKDSDQALFCEGFCATWYHANCVNMSIRKYNGIGKVASEIRWFCSGCDKMVMDWIASNKGGHEVTKKINVSDFHKLSERLEKKLNILINQSIKTKIGVRQLININKIEEIQNVSQTDMSYLENSQLQTNTTLETTSILLAETKSDIQEAVEDKTHCIVNAHSDVIQERADGKRDPAKEQGTDQLRKDSGKDPAKGPNRCERRRNRGIELPKPIRNQHCGPEKVSETSSQPRKKQECVNLDKQETRMEKRENEIVETEDHGGPSCFTETSSIQSYSEALKVDRTSKSNTENQDRNSQRSLRRKAEVIIGTSGESTKLRSAEKQTFFFVSRVSPTTTTDELHKYLNGKEGTCRCTLQYHMPTNPNQLERDDTTLLTRGSDINLLQTEADDLLSEAKDWFNYNRLKLNEEKTQALVCTLKTTVEEEEAVKLLGFWIDAKLSWNTHIAQVFIPAVRVFQPKRTDVLTSAR